MAAQIPPQAALWIARVLFVNWGEEHALWRGHEGNPNNLALTLSTAADLSRLLKRDMELIWMAMTKLTFVQEKRRRLSNPRYLRKKEMAIEMLKYFFNEDETVDDAAMTELSSVMPRNPAPTTLPQPALPAPLAPAAAVPAAASATAAALSASQVQSPPIPFQNGFHPSSSSRANNHQHHHRHHHSHHHHHHHPSHASSPHRSSFAAPPRNVSAASSSSSHKRGLKRPASSISPSHVPPPPPPPPPSITHAAAAAVSQHVPQLKNVSTAKRSPPQRTKVKQEAEIDLLEEDDPTVPRDEQESRLLRELVENMGFGPNSKVEILNAIRRLRYKNQQQLTGEAVMLHIISHREEMEEAKKMDQARIESERLRKEESARRRKAIADEAELKLQTSSLNEWRTERTYFSSSWVLANEYLFSSLQTVLSKINGTVVKDPLLRLLKAERDAKKWYSVLPRAYFETVVSAHISPFDTPAELADKLTTEANKIRNAMCCLGEQEGGVPRLFLEAHDDQTKGSGGGGSNTMSDDNDDEVLLVVQPPPAAAAAKAKTAATTPPRKASPRRITGSTQKQPPSSLSRNIGLNKHDVIDLLDD